MKARVLTAAIILAIVIPIFLLSGYLVYPIALAIFCVMATYEVLKVIEVSNQYSILVPSCIIAFCMPLFAYFAPDDNREVYIYALSAVLLLFMMYLFCVMVFRKGFLTYSKVAEIFMIVAYVTTSFTSLSLTRYLDNGKFTFFLVFIAAWGSDTFAYLVGSLIGKHKLIPEVSPKKTVEGAVGGTVITTLLFVLYGWMVDIWGNVDANYLVLVIYGILLSIVSQIGDLLASVIKREYGVKDYGTILPGHGGIMDRFDSVLAVSTVIMILCLVFPPFV
jgi:phosphatidate cytidylyltransferase